MIKRFSTVFRSRLRRVLAASDRVSDVRGATRLALKATGEIVRGCFNGGYSPRARFTYWAVHGLLTSGNAEFKKLQSAWQSASRAQVILDLVDKDRELSCRLEFFRAGSKQPICVLEMSLSLHGRNELIRVPTVISD